MASDLTEEYILEADTGGKVCCQKKKEPPTFYISM